jgi:hypothetical protein
LYIELLEKGNVAVVNLQGISMWNEDLAPGYVEIPVTSWPAGIYLVSLNGQIASRFSKE